MKRRFSPGLWSLAVAASLPAALLPISNPDLFWHLSAARRIVETLSVPRADWLSWTMAGAPWNDFEWVPQLIFGGAYSLGGLAGAWGLKVLLFAACAWRLRAWLRVYELPEELEAAGVAIWAAGMLPRADLRPELFSILLFIELFLKLERWRITRRSPSVLWIGFMFAAWANLHAGFAYGLGVLVLYAASGLGWIFPAAAAAGTLLNPAGWSIYSVLAGHAVDAGQLSSWIVEWGAPNPANPWRWVELALLPCVAAAGFAAANRGRIPAVAPALALAAFALAGLRHARLNAYWVTASVPIGLSWLAAAKWRPSRAAAAGAIVVCGVWAAACAWDFGLLRRVFEARFVPVGAASYLEAERVALGGKPLYNPWGWGGYLGWRLAGSYPVFQDGRYLFHPLLLESARATGSPEAWQEFLAKRGVEVALLENFPLMLPSTRVYPDKTSKAIARPYYVAYMPRERWALLHFDGQALVFVRRDAVAPEWLVQREFRYLRPRDEEAMNDARSRGEIPAAALEGERIRLPQR